MTHRLRKTLDRRDEGFTLIELLVVMIIIGILAAIAIPAFLTQRAKARDTSAKSDVSTIGKELISYFVDNTAAPTVAIASGRYQVNGADIGAVSSGNSIASSGFNATTPSSKWCVAVKNASGTSTWKYTASAGLSSTTASPACVSGTDY